MNIENVFGFPISINHIKDVSLVSNEIDNILIDNKDKFNSPWTDPIKTTFSYKKENKIINEDSVLHRFVSKSVYNYLYSLSKQAVEFSIEESWINISKNRDFQHYHNHLPYDLSAVYFHNTTNTGEDGLLYFKNPVTSILATKLSPVLQTELSIIPQQGMLVIFPSFVEHAVNENKTDTERVSVAFNVNILGYSYQETIYK